ncbi:hypothetical protein [Pseudofulvibacter geojedonensis]|uniref:Uncharacterized protein n=1 Tax=Pseudofulvibacter geojedonensis TaxID=1123758 RepID=A0ABW3I323_9FLAO
MVLSPVSSLSWEIVIRLIPNNSESIESINIQHPYPHVFSRMRGLFFLGHSKPLFSLTKEHREIRLSVS